MFSTPFLNSLDATNGSTTQTQGQVVNEARNLALHLMAQGISRQDAINRSVGDVGMNNYNFVSQHGFAALRVASTADAEDTVAARDPLINIATSPTQRLTIPTSIKKKFPREIWEKEYKESMQSGGH